MRIEKVLHTNVFESLVGFHRNRGAALVATVTSLLTGSFLTVTSLGRSLRSHAQPKHNIKRVDRLLSNQHLHRERLSIYSAICHRLCANLLRPIILVDWSDLVERDRHMLLRAALVVDNRAIPLFESVYPVKKYNARRTHREFLVTLKALLPSNCTPIIVTDAGFRGPWFRDVESLGWYWLGRVRNCINYRLVSRQQWRQSHRLYARATKKPAYVGCADLSSKRPYRCHLYLYKKLKQYRKATRTVYHQVKHSNSDVFANQQKDPWLIASNLSPEQLTPKQIVHLYGKRMGIEAGFRDLKSDNFGFGLSLARSKDIQRLNILLLIAALATLCLWLVGVIAMENNWHRQFMANTVRNRLVLSIPFLALAVLKRPDYAISHATFHLP